MALTAFAKTAIQRALPGKNNTSLRAAIRTALLTTGSVSEAFAAVERATDLNSTQRARLDGLRRELILTNMRVFERASSRGSRGTRSMAQGRAGYIWGFGRKSLVRYAVVSSLLGGEVERVWFDTPSAATAYFDDAISSGARMAKVEEYEGNKHVGDVARFVKPLPRSRAGRASGTLRARVSKARR